jgi:hypothetical protein
MSRGDASLAEDYAEFHPADFIAENGEAWVIDQRRQVESVGEVSDVARHHINARANEAAYRFSISLSSALALVASGLVGYFSTIDFSRARACVYEPDAM